MNRQFEVDSKGKIQGWNCESCNGYNDILDSYCIYCKGYKPNGLKPRPHILNRRAIDCYLERGLGFTLMPLKDEDKYELHAKFFAEERLFIKDMDMVQLLERENELERVALNAKARINAMQAEKRERKAKLSSEQLEWLRSSPEDQTITNSIRSVSKKRMSKADKLLADMQALGVANAEEHVNKIVNKTTNQEYKSWKNRIEAARGSFDPSKKPEVDTELAPEIQVVKVNPDDKKVDFSSLSFLKK